MVYHAVHEQLTALRHIAQNENLTTIILQDPLSLSWLIGTRWNVQNTLDRACYEAVITGLDTPEPQINIVTSNIEAQRLAETELDHLAAYTMVAVPWQQDRLKELPHGTHVGSDRGLRETTNVSEQITQSRRILTANQQTQIADLNVTAATAVGTVARHIRRGAREVDIAADVTAELMRAGLDVVLCLVGSDQRLNTHRHPIPTMAQVQHRVMISVCARKDGLCTSVTRYISFAPRYEEAEMIFRKLLRVEGAFLEASADAAPLSQVFNQATAAYGATGLNPDQWHAHHQGGIAGFAPRDVLATPDAAETLHEGMVVAWNPSASGWKAESVALVGKNGATLLPDDESWPQISINGYSRPAIYYPN